MSFSDDPKDYAYSREHKLEQTLKSIEYLISEWYLDDDYDSKSVLDKISLLIKVDKLNL